jgi:hypothetical protein
LLWSRLLGSFYLQIASLPLVYISSCRSDSSVGTSNLRKSLFVNEISTAEATNISLSNSWWGALLHERPKTNQSSPATAIFYKKIKSLR